MTDITEKTENGELVTNRDQLVVVDNIEHQDKGELVANCDRFYSHRLKASCAPMATFISSMHHYRQIVRSLRTIL